MLSIPGKPGYTCDGWSRREFMRVGGAGLFGMALGDILRLQALGSESASDAAKNQGRLGEGQISHSDLPARRPQPHRHLGPQAGSAIEVRGEFKTLRSKVPGIWLSEVMPKLAEQMDKATLIRS